MCMDLRETLRWKHFSLRNLAVVVQILILLFKIVVHSLTLAEI